MMSCHALYISHESATDWLDDSSGNWVAGFGEPLDPCDFTRLRPKHHARWLSPVSWEIPGCDVEDKSL